MKKSVMMAALAGIVMFSACNVNDEIQDNDNQAVRFTAGIEQSALPQNAPDGTRASETTWGSGDAIGIFMVWHNGTAIAENAVNKQYTTQGGSTFTAAAGDEIYYPMNSSPVDFIAYYPYESGATLTTSINVMIGDQTNQPAFDLLWAKADNSGAGYDKEINADIPVDLAFGHKLAKIVMNTTADQNVGVTLDGMTVMINGMNTVNTFDLSTGTLDTPGTPDAITPRTIADGSAYDAIIMPGNYSAEDVTVEFTITGGETFIWTLPATDFDGGNEYTYAVKLTRTGVQVTGTITPWITNDRGPVEAD